MKRRIVGPAGLGLAGALLVAGCSAGQITQTASQQPAIEGAMAQAGTIAVRDAELVYPEGEEPAVYRAGSDAEAAMFVVNQGRSADELLSVSSSDANEVVIEGETTVPADDVLAIGPEEPAIEHQQHAELTVRGLKRDIGAGQSVMVTLTFRAAGQVEVQLPIVAPADLPRETSEHETEGEGSGGGH